MITTGGTELLDRAEPLWDRLRQHHALCDPRWSNSLLSRTFADRRAELIARAENGLRVLIASDLATDIGYCICTIGGSMTGEVDSLFVDPAHRHNGLGSELMRLGMLWLGESGAEPIQVNVLPANTGALRFYERHGFRARSVRLLHVSDGEVLHLAENEAALPTIRPATVDDARAISRLIRRNADVVLAPFYSAQQLSAWKKYNTVARVRDRLAGQTTLVAILSGRLCGTIGLHNTELVGLYVSPGVRGRGVGSTLLKHLESFAAARGIARLQLTSTPAALDFYRRKGWRSGKTVVLTILGTEFEETSMSKRLGLE